MVHLDSSSYSSVHPSSHRSLKVLIHVMSMHIATYHDVDKVKGDYTVIIMYSFENAGHLEVPRSSTVVLAEIQNIVRVSTDH